MELNAKYLFGIDLFSVRCFKTTSNIENLVTICFNIIDRNVVPKSEDFEHNIYESLIAIYVHIPNNKVLNDNRQLPIG